MQSTSKDLIDERLQTTRDDIRTMLRDAKIGYTGLSGTGRTVQVRIREANEVEQAKTALADTDRSRSPPACSAAAPSQNWRWTSRSPACCATR